MMQSFLQVDVSESISSDLKRVKDLHSEQVVGALLQGAHERRRVVLGGLRRLPPH